MAILLFNEALSVALPAIVGYAYGPVELFPGTLTQINGCESDLMVFARKVALVGVVAITPFVQ